MHHVRYVCSLGAFSPRQKEVRTFLKKEIGKKKRSFKADPSGIVEIRPLDQRPDHHVERGHAMDAHANSLGYVATPRCRFWTAVRSGAAPELLAASKAELGVQQQRHRNGKDRPHQATVMANCECKRSVCVEGEWCWLLWRGCNPGCASVREVLGCNARGGRGSTVVPVSVSAGWCNELEGVCTPAAEE